MDTSQQKGKPGSPTLGLQADGLRTAFPFHFAFDTELKILQFGPTLSKLLPDIRPGAPLSDFFRLVTPNIALDFEVIDRQSFTVFFLESLDKRFKLKGQMLRSEESGNALMLFLGSPVVRDLSAVSGMDLTLKDFAIHDSAVDFLILLQTKTNTINDVKSMAERLKKEVAERRVAQKELQLINTQLEDRVALRTKELRQEVSERSKAEERVRDTNVKLKTMVSRLEEHNRQMLLLNTMGDMLQSCRSVRETHTVIADSLAKLFPGENGSLALYERASSSYRIVAGWGSEAGDAGREFRRDDCWGLRRSRQHEQDCGDTEAACSHLHHQKHPAGCRYVCVPLATRGEPHGLLHIHGVPSGVDENSATLAEDRRQLIHSASEHISLSIANLKLQETLREQSIRDMLTGLFNRRYMEESLDREIARAKRNGTPCGVIMLDVDHFKKFNDTLGHQAGDAMLAGLGHFLQHHLRAEDIPCRYGGEEFILILPGAELEGTYARAEQIRADVEGTLRVPYEKGNLPAVTISLGVAIYPDFAENAGDLIKAADVALYESKQNGRNQVTVSTGKLHKKKKKKKQAEHEPSADA